MAKEKKTSGGGAPGEREGQDVQTSPAGPTNVSKNGGLIALLVVFGLIALAIAADFLRR